MNSSQLTAWRGDPGLAFGLTSSSISLLSLYCSGSSSNSKGIRSLVCVQQGSLTPKGTPHTDTAHSSATAAHHRPLIAILNKIHAVKCHSKGSLTMACNSRIPLKRDSGTMALLLALLRTTGQCHISPCPWRLSFERRFVGDSSGKCDQQLD